MSESLAAKLRDSSFATIADAQRFVQWYEQAEHVSEWDKARVALANQLIDLADTEGLLVDIGSQAPTPIGFEIEDLCDADD